MDEHDTLATVVRDTLVNIAGVSGTAAKHLRPGQSLIADLGLDEVDLEVLAGCQLETSRVLATLTILEMKRLVRRLPGGYLVRAY